MAYSYASDKQITAELIAGDILPSSGFTSSYDAGNRLTTWQTPLASASTQQQAWNYDNAGNWNSTTINGTTTENRTHSAADQLNTIAGNATTNDLKGNLTTYEINGKEYEVEYDLDNRIIKVEVNNSDVEYRYDAFGRRIIRQEGSTKSALIWWGNSENAEHKHQAGQTVIQNDIMAHPDRLNSVIARAKDGSKFKLEWYHKNYLDHVYAVSDDSGDILEHYRYTAFGEVTIYNENGQLQNTTQIDNHILWNTRRRDEVTGYYMYKFRHYSAELGRWPSRDPIEEKGGVNLYEFVGNDSVNRWDILGLQRHHWYKQDATSAALAAKICPDLAVTSPNVGGIHKYTSWIDGVTDVPYVKGTTDPLSVPHMWTHDSKGYDYDGKYAKILTYIQTLPKKDQCCALKIAINLLKVDLWTKLDAKAVKGDFIGNNKGVVKRYDLTKLKMEDYRAHKNGKENKNGSVNDNTKDFDTQCTKCSTNKKLHKKVETKVKTIL